MDGNVLLHVFSARTLMVLGSRGLHIMGAAALMMCSAPASAAELGGIILPDTLALDGTDLHLNGIALRTYSWMRIHIYVAGLYLEHTSHDATEILNSSEKKILVVRFVHDVDATNARKAWREGLEKNCRVPCHLAPSDLDRFLAAVPAMRSGNLSMLAFTAHGLRITLNGHTMGTITDPVFSRAVLAGFIGPEPPTAQLKRELLHNEQ
jgi:Chalcone isomerase-like